MHSVDPLPYLANDQKIGFPHSTGFVHYTMNVKACTLEIINASTRLNGAYWTVIISVIQSNKITIIEGGNLI